MITRYSHLFKRLLALTLCLILLGGVAATLPLTAAAADINAFADGNNVPVQVTAHTGTLGQHMYVNGTFSGFGMSMPTFSSPSGNQATLAVYTWDQNPVLTMSSAPLHEKRFDDCKDNAMNWVTFDPPLPAGDYFFVIKDTVGTVGCWTKDTNHGSLGYMYQDDQESACDLQMAIRFTEPTDPPFKAVEKVNDGIKDGENTPPPAYVIPDDSPIYTHEVMPDTWVFTDALGRTSLTNAEVGDPREDRTVAMFYWTWHLTSCYEGEPLNVQEFLEEHPDAINDFDHPAWPTTNTTYFWNQPIYGYYRTNDPWVLRRQAELLANAGVDTIFTDNTNDTRTWRESYTMVYETWLEAMEGGVRTPKVSYILPFWNTNGIVKTQLTSIYKDVYRTGKYQPLWFYWDGKPAIMAQTDIGLDTDNPLEKDISEFFTFRPNYPGYTNSAPSFGTWGWLSIYPQAVYYANRNDRKDKIIEQTTVGVAMNHDYVTGQLSAMNGQNIMGRSYTSDKSHLGEEGSTLWGYNFAEQFNYALAKDPKMIFITGWNEWVAGRHQSWQGVENALPDQCNDEYSRDIEPTKGALGDNYYYQLVNFVRQYKGVRPIPTPGLAQTIDLSDGARAWENVEPYYAAYIGNTGDRDADGHGSTHYTEFSGRNDLIGARVARDEAFVYFYVECAQDITPYTDNLWMVLYLDTDQSTQGWNTFDYVINKSAASADTLVLERFTGTDYNTEKVTDVTYRVDGATMTVKVPKAALGLSGYDFTINFAWTDNVHDEADTGTQNADGTRSYTTFTGDIMDFYISGDVAPGGRFKYSYISTAENAGVAVETETVAETTVSAPDTSPATEAPADTTPAAPQDTSAVETAAMTEDMDPETQPAAGGCRSALPIALLPLLLLTTAFVRRKKA